MTNAEVDDQDKDGLWEMHWDAGRKGALGFAVWVLLTGGLLLTVKLLRWDAGFWDLAWPSALLVFGIWGLFPKFSFFSLGCTLFGGFFLVSNLGFQPFALGKELLFPVLLLLFGLSLLADALRKPKKGSFRFVHNGKNLKKRSHSFHMDEEEFDCDLSFGEERHYIDLPRLARGCANVSFGELTIDLTGCKEFAPDCALGANASFGNLQLILPKTVRAEVMSSTAFGNVETKGQPENPTAVIRIEGNASFGNLSIRYV